MMHEIKMLLHFGNEVDGLDIYPEIYNRLGARINDIRHVDEVILDDHAAFAEIDLDTSEDAKATHAKIEEQILPLLRKYSAPPEGYRITEGDEAPEDCSWCYIKNGHEDSHRYETQGEAFAAAWQDAEGDIYS